MSGPSQIDPFTRGVLYDALVSGQKQYWLKRAADFEAAKPKLGEFYGSTGPEDLNSRWRLLDEVARACRARAEITISDDELERLLRDAE